MSEEKATLENVRAHFEKIADEYDFHKKRAWYYYDWLKKICKKHISLACQKRILELGCGTGDVLASLNPKYGLGIDISKKMIALARKKHRKKSLRFETGASKAQFLCCPSALFQVHQQSCELCIQLYPSAKAYWIN